MLPSPSIQLWLLLPHARPRRRRLRPRARRPRVALCQHLPARARPLRSEQLHRPALAHRAARRDRSGDRGRGTPKDDRSTDRRDPAGRVADRMPGDPGPRPHDGGV